MHEYFALIGYIISLLTVAKEGKEQEKRKPERNYTTYNASSWWSASARVKLQQGHRKERETGGRERMFIKQTQRPQKYQTKEKYTEPKNGNFNKDNDQTT